MHPERQRYLDRHGLKSSDIIGLSNDEIMASNRAEDRLWVGLRLIVLSVALLLISFFGYPRDARHFLAGMASALILLDLWTFIRSFPRLIDARLFLAGMVCAVFLAAAWALIRGL